MKPTLAALSAMIFAVAAYGGEDARAERERAMKLYQSHGTPQDDARAVAMLEHAAEGGDLVAQVNLATIYEYGLFVPRDEARSAKWWLAAAEQGDPRAQFRAGEMLWMGWGMARDRAEALKWWTLARERGEAEWMRATIAGLRVPPSEADWEEARGRAKAWHAAKDAARP